MGRGSRQGRAAVEDQPTDSSDLTGTAGASDTAGASKDTAASAVDKPAPNRGGVPVGQRSGRHRTFRPRPGGGHAEGEAVEAETPAVEETVETEIPAELSPKGKRRPWFRGRSDKAADATAGAEVVEEPPAPSEIAESADDAEEFPAEAPDDEEPDAKPVGPKPVGRRMVIAVAVAAALFVAAGAFGGAMLQPYLADRTVANTRRYIARTAASAITTLFTYTPDDMDQLSARSAKYLGGDLRDSYAKQVDALAATNKQNQIRRSAQVVGAAVESLNGPNATALVYANITYNSAATKDVPKIFLVSYRLTMQRKGSDWVVTNMPWITSKDLTRITP